MIERYFEDFVMLDERTVPDTFGGTHTEYVEGAPFRGGITTKQSTEAQIAYQTGVKTIYVIITRPNVTLKHEQYVVRRKDGRRYRITGRSADMVTPDVAWEKFQQVTAEVVEP